MHKVIISACLLLFPITLLAQDYWGYCVASIYHESIDGNLVKYVFISGIKPLASLNCINSKKPATIKERYSYKFYTACIEAWFYEKLAASEHKAAQFITKEDIFGTIGIFRDSYFRYMYGKEPTRLDSLNYEKNHAFMDRRKAMKHRNDLVKVGIKNTKEVMLLIH